MVFGIEGPTQRPAHRVQVALPALQLVFLRYFLVGHIDTPVGEEERLTEVAGPNGRAEWASVWQRRNDCHRCAYTFTSCRSATAKLSLEGNGNRARLR